MKGWYVDFILIAMAIWLLQSRVFYPKVNCPIHVRGRIGNNVLYDFWLTNKVVERLYTTNGPLLMTDWGPYTVILDPATTVTRQETVQ